MKHLIFKELYLLAQNLNMPLYIVGGAVRDYLADKKKIKGDIDICSPARLEDIVDIAKKCGFKVSDIYGQVGTAKLKSDNGWVEFCSFRHDRYKDGIHTPISVEFTKDISIDAKRRDFKINAIYYDILKDKFVDPLNAMEDIKNKSISATRDGVFSEDGLRLMRLARIAGMMNYDVKDECLQDAKNHAHLIKDISPNRIYSELIKILQADSVYENPTKMEHYHALKILESINVLDMILPELCAGRGMEQRSDFHKYDVLEHSLNTTKYASSNVRLAALLHDVGKPFCMSKNGAYKLHDIEGEKISIEILERLLAPKHTIAQVSKLTRLHMYDIDSQTSEEKVKEFIIKNIDVIEDLLDLKQADYSGAKDDISPSPVVLKWKKILKNMKESQTPLGLKELRINGDDLLKLGFKGAKIGEALESLLLQCIKNPSLNTKEALINRAKSLLPSIT